MNNFWNFEETPEEDKNIFFVFKNVLFAGKYTFGIIKHSDDSDFEEWGFIYNYEWSSEPFFEIVTEVEKWTYSENIM